MGHLFSNPVIAAQAQEDTVFVAHPHIGHTLPIGKDFIGQTTFLSIESVIESWLRSGQKDKKIVLNIGDSSTSGWNSDIVTTNRHRVENGQEPLSAFFSYDTYSDIMRLKLGSGYGVINAGVPAHTSLQGSRRLELLLDTFWKAGVSIAFVTVYYGNNDSVWDANRTDDDWISGRRTTSTDGIVSRVPVGQYRSSMEDIIGIVRKFGAIPILIEPVTPLYWSPGTRVCNEILPKREGFGSAFVYDALEKAVEWHTLARRTKTNETARALLDAARESDYVVPRIKRGHALVLSQVAQETQTVLVRTNIDRHTDDGRYFIDYCHPNAAANALIADGIIGVITSTTTAGANNPLPTDHYTLY